MNLFKKIGIAVIGMAMAVGVGVAVGGNQDATKVEAVGTKITNMSSVISGSTYYIGATTSNTDYYFKASSTEEGTGLSGSAVTDYTEATPVTLVGSGSSWAIQFANGNYMDLASSKANGKYNVVTSSVNWTVTTSNSLLVFTCNGGTYMLQKNSSGTQFGSYSSSQTKCWLTTTTVSVTGVSLNKNSTTIVLGNTETLTATISPNGATDSSVSWSSSDESVATVSSAGVVTAVAAGSCTITVTTTDGSYTDTCAVTVTSGSVAVTGVSLNKNSTSLVIGNTETLTATVSPNDATDSSVSWSSSNTNVATVSSAGVVTAVAKGSTTITVTTTDGGYTDTCAVTVTAPSSVTFTAGTDIGTSGGQNADSITKSGITFSGTKMATTTAEYRLYASSTVTFTSTIGKMSSIQFTKNGSYSYSLISVNDDNGEYNSSTGLWEGEATSVSFTLSAQFRADAIQVNIASPVVTLNKASVNVEKDGEDTSVVATAKFFSGTPTITASTESGLIAVEYTSGHLEILAGSTTGEATVTITATYSTEVANVNLIVYVIEASVPVTNIAVSKAHNNDLYIGQTVQLTATVTPDNATDGTVTWSSSSDSVATVNSTGLVTAAGVGSVTITATANDGSGVYGTASVTVVAFPTFTEVTSTDELFNGMTVVIASKAGTNLLSTTQNSNNRGTVSSTINNSVITPSALGFAELTLGIEEMDNGTIVYSFYDPANSGYLYAANSSNNYMRTEATLDNNGRFSLSIEDGEATLLAQGTYTHNYVRFNSTLFSCYVEGSSTGTAVSLFAKTGQTVTDAQKIETFIAKNMKMNSYDKGGDEGSTAGDGSCTTYYATAKAAFNSNTLMSDSARSTFCSDGTYSAAYNRLRDWATANEDSFNKTTHVLEASRTDFASSNNVTSNSSSATAAIIVSVLGFTAIGGYFFLRRRKEF